MFRSSLVFFCLLTTSCAQNSQTLEVPEGYEPTTYARAVKIAGSTIILDGHVDVPYRLIEEMEDISESTAKGDFDFPRARAGGLDAPFMSIYIPAALQSTDGASKQHAARLIAMMDSIIAANPGKFASALSPTDVIRNFERGAISFPYGMENGSAIEDDIQNVEYFFDKGIRYITLTHSQKNLICDSSYDQNTEWNGLSPFGRRVVAEMNRLGVMIDLSHVSDSTFYQVLRLTKTPAICSHSSCRHFTPGYQRNVSDDMLRALAENGGVIQINFGSAFLTKAAMEHSVEMWTELSGFMATEGLADFGHPKVAAKMKEYEAEHPLPFASVEDVADHIDYVVKVAGIDHVGLGSDFDGVGDSLPTDLKSVADYPKLIYHLLKRGYSEADVEKVLSRNVLRVWRTVEAFAKTQE